MSWWEAARHRPRTHWKNLHLPFSPRGGSWEEYGVLLVGEKESKYLYNHFDEDNYLPNAA